MKQVIVYSAVSSCGNVLRMALSPTPALLGAEATGPEDRETPIAAYTKSSIGWFPSCRGREFLRRRGNHHDFPAHNRLGQGGDADAIRFLLEGKPRWAR